nr:hypothetical protein [Escherichia coli]
MIKTTLLFFATALCEIIGCFLPWLWLKRNASIWLLLPAGISLALFVWLLSCILRRVGVFTRLMVAFMFARR